jgi:hypothetical protein
MARPRPAGRRDRLKEFKRSSALDAGLLAAGPAVEHYEISRYGTLKTWADELGLAEAVALLDVTLQALTQLAQTAVNQEAQQAAEQSDHRGAVVRRGDCLLDGDRRPESRGIRACPTKNPAIWQGR